MTRTQGWIQSWGPSVVNTSALVLSLLLILPEKLSGGCGIRVHMLVFVAILGLGIVGLTWAFLAREWNPMRASFYWSVLAGVATMIFLVMPTVPLVERYTTC